jgi:chromosome segregation ATPase
MEEHQGKPCHDLSDPKFPDFGDCMSTASTISSANSDIDDQDDNVVNSSPIAALGVTKIEVSRGIENEKLKEEMLNARIALLDQNNTILELEGKLKVQKRQIKERNQVLLDMTVKFEKEMTGLKDIIMAKRKGEEIKQRDQALSDEVALLKMELKHLSTSLDEENREKMTIKTDLDKVVQRNYELLREKDLAVCSLKNMKAELEQEKHLRTTLDEENREKITIIKDKDEALARAMEREKKNVQEIVRFAIEVERSKAENLKLFQEKDEAVLKAKDENLKLVQEKDEAVSMAKNFEEKIDRAKVVQKVVKSVIEGHEELEFFSSQASGLHEID